LPNQRGFFNPFYLLTLSIAVLGDPDYNMLWLLVFLTVHGFKVWG